MTSINDALNLHGQGWLDDAEAAYCAILAREPKHFDALHHLGILKLQKSQPAEAREWMQRAVDAKPDSPDALASLALVLMALNEHAEALAACDRALAIANHPGAWITRGNALSRLERLTDALASFDEALKIQGNSLEALIGRGTALAWMDRPDEAIATIAQIDTANNPNDLLKRAQLQSSLGLHAAAVRDYQRLIEIKPQALPTWVELLTCASDSCDWRAAEEPARRVLAAIEAGQWVQPMLALRISSDPSVQLKSARTAAPRLPATAVPSRHKSRPERLRIAYISPDFRIHPLAYLIPELLERHDRTRFEIVGVSLGPDDGSDIRARVVRAFDCFHDVQALSDGDMEAMLRKLQIDIAVDLAGYTEYARTNVLARRIAAVQASYLGYCGTSGGNFKDYMITDRIAVPESEQRHFTEKLVYLPGSFMVADTMQPVADVVGTRSEHGLPQQGFVLCCFNKNYKITEPVFDVWMRLLRAVDDSVLWLSANLGHGRDNLRKAAAARGVDPQRIKFAPNVKSRAEHLARHRVADLFVDTLPYNAHTTACDALFTGLPVLTTTGPTMVGRVAASMLHAVGLDELVTPDLNAYEARALELMRDPEQLRGLRLRLAANRATHPLFDTARFCRNLERAYDRMFEIYIRGEPPQTFDVSEA